MLIPFFYLFFALFYWFKPVIIVHLSIGSAKERFSHTTLQEMSVSMDTDGDCPFNLEVTSLVAA